MLIVMLIILMATATAFFAIHATAYEIRASGHVRQAVQTQYIAETGAVGAMSLVDEQGPVAFQKAMRHASEDNRQASGANTPLPLEQFGEPDLAPDMEGYRMTLAEMQNDQGVQPVDRDDIGGAHQAYAPALYVDVYDKFAWTGNVAGERADGYGRLEYMRATYTSRGRTRVAGGDVKGSLAQDTRDYHEGADDARAHGLSGPYGAQVGGGQ